MKTTIIERSELPSKEARILDSKIDNRSSDGHLILPGVTQEQAITKVWPILEDAQKILGDSIWRCLTDMSTLKLPMGIWDDSSYARKIRNLSVNVDSLFLSKIREVATFFATAEHKAPEHVWINKLSNGGFPHFTNSPKLKVAQVLSGCEKINAGDPLPRHAFTTLRVQPEAVVLSSDGGISAKPRKWMYSAANAKDIHSIYGIDITKFEGAQIDGDIIWGTHVTQAGKPFVQPARPRWASAIDLETNAPSIMIGHLLMDPHCVSESLYIVRSIDNIKDFVHGFYTSCIDFENFERTVTFEMINAIVEVFCFYHPSISHIYERMYDDYFNMTMYGIDALPNDRGKMSYVYTEMKSDPLGIFGILSGWGQTSQLGKIIGTAFVAYCAESIGVSCSQITEYEDLMRNCGDDNIVRFRDSATQAKFEAFLLEQNQLKASLEDPKKYLGIQLIDVDGISDSASMSANSFIENTLCPERQAGSAFKKFSVLGLQQRWDLYSQHMPDRARFSLCERLFNALKDEVDDFDAVLEQEKRDSVASSDLDEFLRKFELTKPEEIFYKLDFRKLSKEDLQMIGIVIPVNEILERIPGISEIPNFKL